MFSLSQYNNRKKNEFILLLQKKPLMPTFKNQQRSDKLSTSLNLFTLMNIYIHFSYFCIFFVFLLETEMKSMDFVNKFKRIWSIFLEGLFIEGNIDSWEIRNKKHFLCVPAVIVLFSSH